MTAETAKKGKALGWVVLGLLVVSAALAVYRLVLYKPPGPKWVTAKVTRGEVAQIVSATGTLNPVVLSPVGAQVSGIVWKIHADYNSPVKKGQLLVELDPALFQSAVRREEANVAAAQAAVLKAQADARNATIAATRARALAAQNYIALADRDTAVAQEQSARAGLAGAEAGVKQAQANLEKVKLDLKNSVVLSPVDGVVIARNVELGQAVVASFQAPNLFTIAEDLSKMQVLANVDEADIGFVKVGAMAQFTVDSYRNRRFSAKVAQVRNAPQTVQNVVTYVVVLEVDNSEQLLKPGMTANVRLEVARRPSALLIPSAALRFKPKLERAAGGEAGRGRGGHGDGDKAAGRRDEGEGKRDGSDRGARATVWVPEGESPRPLRISTGITDGTFTEVVSGLEEDQVVIVEATRTGGASGGGAGPAGMPRPGGPGGGGGMRRGGL
jgi:HlyD family secretion protein